MSQYSEATQALRHQADVLEHLAQQSGQGQPYLGDALRQAVGIIRFLLDALATNQPRTTVQCWDEGFCSVCGKPTVHKS